MSIIDNLKARVEALEAHNDRKASEQRAATRASHAKEEAPDEPVKETTSQAASKTASKAGETTKA